MFRTVILAIAATVLFHCAGSLSIPEEAMAKLDATLQMLVRSKPLRESDYEISYRANGEKEYVVLITSDNREELRAAGVQIVDSFDELVVAKTTVDELTKIVSLASVRSVRNNASTSPQNHNNRRLR